MKIVSLGEWKICLMRSIEGSKSKMRWKMRKKKILLAMKLLHRVKLRMVSSKLKLPV